ncbi:MAG: extracellular solute-binding protein [Lactobacillus sp.]|jgi:putative aldouronate transport system substrate-binding protein|nr:extracellular solute-binding protein [Lactobacillus sp.]MCI2032018.1 extracellular solute-binding protein [Lactobacillus sp.]
MKKFKVLGLTLAALALLVAGCGKKQATATKDSSGATIIKIAYKDDNSSNKVAKQYYTELAKELKKKEKINVKFKVVDLPSEGYSDKLNLQISSGDIPDIIYFQGGDTPFAQQGVLEDLRPYVKKSKYLKSEMTETNQKRLNNYPYLLWIKPLSASVPVVKKSVLAQVPDADTLIQNPTVDNYKKLLTELVGKKDGKGNAATYGITTAGTVDELDSIFDMAFGNTSTWVKQDGKYVYKRTSDNEKKKIAFYRDLYKQGILDKSFLTKKWDTKESAFYDGKSGMILGTSGKVVDLYNDKVKQLSNDTLVALPPAKGVAQGYGATDLSKEDRGIAISSQSPNKKIAFKILDYLGSPEGQLLDRFGFKNYQYKLVNNKVELTDKAADWYARFWEPRKVTIPYKLEHSLMSGVADNSMDKVDQYYTADNSFIMPEKYVTKWDAAENVYKEYVADAITGKKSLDDFDKFISDWNAAGGKLVTEYANKHIKE